MTTFFLLSRQNKCLFLNFHLCRVRGISNHTPHGDPLEPEDYEDCYSTLEVSSNADQESVRQAFLRLVKRYHPDSSSGDAARFSAIEAAYRKLQNKFSKQRWGVDDGAGEYGLYYKERQRDIKLTAPQHRQYLSYDGYGIGNPHERQKQHEKQGASNAVESVRRHRVDKLTVTHEEDQVMRVQRDAKKTRTSSELDRLVEDMILESMTRGDFDNLAGSGKPLPFRRHDNPYVDFVTHKMNQVLIDNGFTPKWITLQKELRHDLTDLRQRLSDIRSRLPSNPLPPADLNTWLSSVNRFVTEETNINRKIDRYNLLVPLLVKQMARISLTKEAEKVLQEGEVKMKEEEVIEEVRDKDMLLSFINAILSRR